MTARTSAWLQRSVCDRGSKVYPIAPKKIAGFKEEVFYNKKLSRTPTLRGGASMTRIVKTVIYGNTNRRWSGFGASDNFAVRWTGVIQVSKPGKYRFRLGSDDGSKLYVGGRYTVNNDGLHGSDTIMDTLCSATGSASICPSS